MLVHSKTCGQPTPREVKASRNDAHILTLALISLAFAALFVLYWDTAQSMVTIWSRSETFAHGFLILPISAWLVWKKRWDLSRANILPSSWGLLVLLLLSSSWFLAEFASIQVARQLFFVAMFPALVFTLLGWETTKLLLFPLGFLLFAVPMGEGLIPPMMDFTAWFVVNALRWTGIPVYSEGLYFVIPSGSWSVVEACSGIRYLIASITLGFLYAYLSYRSFWRRAVFVVLAGVVPILANGVRAYLVVMIGHLSGNKLAAGVDHLVYGWVFFGMVMLLLFWIGSKWQERGLASEFAEGNQAGKALAQSSSPGHLIGFTLAAVVVLSVWPLWVQMLQSTFTKPVVALRLVAPDSLASWVVSGDIFTEWRPRFVGPTTELSQVYRNGSDQVGLFISYYAQQRQGQELINNQNSLLNPSDRAWTQAVQQKVHVPGEIDLQTVLEAKLLGPSQNLLVWRYYWVEGQLTADAYAVKLIEIQRWLKGRTTAGAAVLLYTPYDENDVVARERLRDFLSQMSTAIQQILASPRTNKQQIQ